MDVWGEEEEEDTLRDREDPLHTHLRIEGV